MIIISHRGYWQNENEKNKSIAFVRSFCSGYGTETDIRDFNGKLVISHDIPNVNSLTVDEFFHIYNKHCSKFPPPLALNVKADGLQNEIKHVLNKYNINNYFFFDMSIPDTLGYLASGLNTFLRISEYEKENLLLERAQGVWLDGFLENIIDEKMIQNFIDRNKKVCIVSPELHGREHLNIWGKYKLFSKDLLNSNQLIICTDLPEEAKEFFNE